MILFANAPICWPLVVPPLSRASKLPIAIPVPGVAVVSSSNADVSAPIRIARPSAVIVEHLCLCHARSVGPDAGNFSLSKGQETVVRWPIAEDLACISNLIVPAVAPSVKFFDGRTTVVRLLVHAE